MSDEGTTGNPGPAGLLTQKDYARRRGWSKQYVNQLVKQGRIPLVNGRIDPAAADAALAGMRDPSRASYARPDPAVSAAAVSNIGPEAAPGVQGTFAKARTVREHFRALKERMEYEAAAGQLVDRQEIEEVTYDFGVLFRQHMTRAAEPIAALVADRFKVDHGVVVDLVSTGINQAIQRLADEIRDNEWGFDKGLPRERDADDDRTG